MSRLAFVTAAVAFAALGGSGAAQEVALPDPVVAPAPAKAGVEPEVAVEASEIDLANIVTAAAKAVTTVQEAPAIVTVITADDIKALGHKWVIEALSTVPGWLEADAEGSQIQHSLVRGVGQAVLSMRDGVSMFEPWGNSPWLSRTLPIEVLKRIEVVTGPGGVLWGANSFLGIANMITKDADDVRGVEASAGYGDGPGNRQDMKAYAMFGKSLWNGKLKIFQHVSYESWIGEVFDVPQVIAYSPPPQPNGPIYVGAPMPRDPQRSWLAIVDGKYSLGPVTLYYTIPFGVEHPNLGFGNVVSNGITWNTYDRYGIHEYKDRFFHDRFGLTVKGYGVQFVRDAVIQALPPSTLLPAGAAGTNDPGGLTFQLHGHNIFRAGGTVDAELQLPRGLRLLLGGELFYEGIEGSTATFLSPSDPSKLPVLCAVDTVGQRLPGCARNFVYDTGRFVGAGYVDLQWRVLPTLTLDGGVRLQAGWGALPYALTPLYSAALVWSFARDYHLKLTYANGFRAPVFQDTSSVPGGVNIGANPTLQTESSQSVQAEVNARLLRNVGDLRELELRLDYSYSLLSNLITISGGAYDNSGRRGVHTVEAFARMYLKGEHFLQASYTFLYSVSSISGVIRATPNNWAVVAGSFNLVRHLLDVNASFSLFGAYEDPNRYPAANGSPIAATTAGPANIAFDRLSPVAMLQLGVRVRFLDDRLQASAQVYNALNQHFYWADNFYDLTPTLENTPNPGPGFNCFASISYRYGF